MSTVKVNTNGINELDFPAGVTSATVNDGVATINLSTGGGGTVASVALTVPSRQSVSGSPITTSGTLAVTDNTQAANLMFAGPSSGSAATPTFRALVAADLPAGTGTGTVTSVGLSAPGIFTVSGSPVTVSGTLALALATESANLVFAGPTSGSAAAPTFRSLVAADLPSGTGTVTSVGLSAPGIFTVSGSPVTTSGTLTFALATEAANLVFAGPSSGSAAAPTFRSLAPADLPIATSAALGAVQPDGTIITVSSGAITVPKASSSVFGVVEVDGTSITASSGVISATGSSSGGLVLLETHTASNSATLDFSAIANASYDTFQFEFVNIEPATDSVDFGWLASTNGGSSYDTSSIYSWYRVLNGNASHAYSTSFAIISDTLRTDGTVAPSGFTGTGKLYNPGSSTGRKQMGVGNINIWTWGSGFDLATGTSAQTYESSSSHTAMTNIRFKMSSGNIASGTIRCYGLKAS
jgi:hypothetical protein